MTGREQRWLNPHKGFFKLWERRIDRWVSRYVYPHLLGIWSPYSWQLPRQLMISETTLSPARWSKTAPPLRVLFVSDFHLGPFVLPEVLSPLIVEIMRLEPDLVAIGGDIITGHARDIDGFVGALAPLAAAPLGAWFCFGNHEYFSPDPFHIVEQLQSVGIHTLRNHAVRLAHGGATFVLGGIDDIVLGRPDWERLVAPAGPPHILLAHNPDVFYEAERRGIDLVLAGHTHAGQIRFPGGRPLVRQSRYCLDEGVMTFGSAFLVVSRGIGASGLPWRMGARPEVVLLTLRG